MLVSTILEAKGDVVATIPRAATLGTAVAELVRHRVGALVVSPGDGTIEGILSERDVVRCLSELHADMLDAAGAHGDVVPGPPVLARRQRRLDHEPHDRGADPPRARWWSTDGWPASSASATW